MANYVDVDVRIIAEPTAILDMTVEVANTVAEEARGGSFNTHLQALIDKRTPKVPEVEGLWLDYRSHILHFEIEKLDTLGLYLEQPYNANLSRLQNWAKTFDPESKVLFVCFSEDGWTTNDRAQMRANPNLAYEDIA